MAPQAVESSLEICFEKQFARPSSCRALSPRSFLHQLAPPGAVAIHSAQRIQSHQPPRIAHAIFCIDLLARHRKVVYGSTLTNFSARFKPRNLTEGHSSRSLRRLSIPYPVYRTGSIISTHTQRDLILVASGDSQSYPNRIHPRTLRLRRP